ncbi:MAG: PASTA domain-containing protein [Pseudonocardiales bacterium]
MTRRVLTILGISILLAVGLGACGSSTPQQAPGAPPSSAPVNPAPTATATSWTIPDLVGSNLQSAQDQIQSLTDFAITVTTSHDATGSGRQQVLDINWKVCSQNIPPGSTIDSGTRIDFGAVKVEERCP